MLQLSTALFNNKRSTLLLPLIIFFSVIIMVFPVVGHTAATIIPCGNSNTSGQNGETMEPCTFQHLLKFVSKFIDFALTFMTALATLAILYAGFLYLTSGAKPEQRSQATGIFWKIGEAFFYVLIAYLLVKFVVLGLVDPTLARQIFG